MAVLGKLTNVEIDYMFECKGWLIVIDTFQYIEFLIEEKQWQISKDTHLITGHFVPLIHAYEIYNVTLRSKGSPHTTALQVCYNFPSECM